MSVPRLIVRRLRALFRRERIDRDMSDELRVHLELQAAENEKRGMPPDEARLAAQRSFGGVEQIKERCRDQRTWIAVEQFMQDLRYGFRALSRNAGFTAVAVLTLALGIGANTAIFSAVYAVLWRPLPYAAAERIFSTEVIVPGRTDSLLGRIQDFREWRAAETVFAAAAALRPATYIVTGAGEPERLGGARVSTNFFAFMGVAIRHGRGFADDEERPGNDRVVILSDAFWRRRFAGDPSVVGRTMTLDGEPNTIVGIAPPELVMPTGTMLHPMLAFGSGVDLWRPLAPTPAELQSESWNHGILVRLRPGANQELGRQQLQAMVNQSIRRQVPDLKVELVLRLVPLREIFSGKVWERLLLVFCAAILLLAIACANVANLLQARAASRSGEFATRVALGAGRARMLRQMLAETLLLALLGAAAGAGMAWAGTTWLIAHAPAEVRLLTHPEPSGPVFGFALVVALAATFACGAFPAWQVFRRNTAEALRGGGRSGADGRRGGAISQMLIGLQMALSTGLLLIAALLLHSFINVLRADRGYDVDRVLAVDLAVSGPRYGTAEKRTAFFSDLTDRSARLPGVQAAGCISDLPVSGEASTNQVIFRDEDTDSKIVLQRPVAAIHCVTSGYFSAIGTTLRDGRLLRAREETPSAVISESLARRLWPQEALSAVLGRGFRQGDVTGPVITVVGVIGIAPRHAHTLALPMPRSPAAPGGPAAPAAVSNEQRGPCIRAPGSITKNHKPALLPISEGLAAELRELVAADAPAFRLAFWKLVPKNPAFRSDLERARIKPIDELGRRADLHALRKTFGTHLVLSGVEPRVVMEAMRQSDLKLTMKTYMDAAQLRGPVLAAVSALPWHSLPTPSVAIKPAASQHPRQAV